MDDVDSLTVKEVSDLHGIECLSNLMNLDLSSSTLTDFSPLAGLAKLWWLSVSDAALVDLSPFAAVPHLETFYVVGQFADLSPLASLPELTHLAVDSLPAKAQTALRSCRPHPRSLPTRTARSIRSWARNILGETCS